MELSDLTPFMVPVVGAAAAFVLSRGSAERRSRATALEDLQIHEKTGGVLDPGDPLADQVKAHARTSLRRYHAVRVSVDQRGTRIANRLLLGGVILSCWVILIAGDLQDPWALFFLGGAGGLVVVVGETLIARSRVRKALKYFATQS